MPFFNRRLHSRLWPVFLLAWLCAVVGGCATYAPAQLDPKTGLYSTSTELDKAAIREYETAVDPRTFRFVVLTASSNVYPGRFEFFARNALADLGLKQVLNQNELLALVKMHPKLKDLTNLSDPLTLKKVSDTVGPILLVDFNSLWDGDVRRYVALKVSDASSGKILLRVEHPKLIWANVDSEAHYPVMNVLRQWFKASSGEKFV